MTGSADRPAIEPKLPTSALLAAMLVATTLFACSDSTTMPELGGEIVLPIRLHVLESDIPSLNADITSLQAAELLAHANEAWAQANISWELTEIFHEEATGLAAFHEMVIGQREFSSDIVLGALPMANREDDAWDAFILRDFGLAPLAGLYFGSGLLASEITVDGSGIDLTVGAARVLAHELGHSLGLGHPPCPPEGNLMASGCTTGDRTRLDEAQIRTARRRAARGRPF